MNTHERILAMLNAMLHAKSALRNENYQELGEHIDALDAMLMATEQHVADTILEKQHGSNK